MYCPKCNICYMDDGKFCEDCGTALVPNSFQKEKKSYPLKIILAVAALVLALAAGYALFKNDSKAPVQPGKVPGPEITDSALNFTAGNSVKSPVALTRHVKPPAEKAPERIKTASTPAVSPAPAVASAAPAATAIPKGKPCVSKAPSGVGVPRAANTATPSGPEPAKGNVPAQKPVTRQPQMVVIRDPLCAESRN